MQPDEIENKKTYDDIQYNIQYNNLKCLHSVVIQSENQERTSPWLEIDVVLDICKITPYEVRGGNFSNLFHILTV